MKFLKILGSVVLLVVCLTVIVWSGYFLWSALPREQEAPAILSTEQLFMASEQEEPVDTPDLPPVGCGSSAGRGAGTASRGSP